MQEPAHSCVHVLERYAGKTLVLHVVVRRRGAEGATHSDWLGKVDDVWVIHHRVDGSGTICARPDGVAGERRNGKAMAMKQRYRHHIEHFCQARGIDIPSSFYRLSTSRYAAIDESTVPSRLVAKTWFNKESLSYYLSGLARPDTLRAFDFHEGYEMLFDGEDVKRGPPIQ